VQLREAGHGVRCTRRARSRTDFLDGHGLDWVDADVTEPDSLARAFAGADVVFHCAALVTARRKVTPDVVAANVHGTRHVVDAVRQAGVKRLVYCSSVVAVGLSEDGAPSDETATWNFDRFGLDDAYAITKRDAELVVHEAVAAGLDAVIVNPT
jgi:dihydroflavonol-4-reductase